MTERITPERFYASLDGIKNQLSRAIDITGLQSTNGLCHQINYAIALRLGQDFGLPIKEFKISNARDFINGPPSIGYLPQLELSSKSGINNHTSLLVFGVEDNPILLDGANDQLDSANPFLIAKVNGQNYNTVNISLKRDNRRIKEDNPDERALKERLKKSIPSIIAASSRVGAIAEEEARLILSQFIVEDQVGLTALFALNRDWISYFAKALGVNYPSTQEIREKVYILMNQNGIPTPKILNQNEDTLTHIANALKREGLI